MVFSNEQVGARSEFRIQESEFRKRIWLALPGGSAVGKSG
jgi:hypothetical protein